MCFFFFFTDLQGGSSLRVTRKESKRRVSQIHIIKIHAAQSRFFCAPRRLLPLPLIALTHFIEQRRKTFWPRDEQKRHPKSIKKECTHAALANADIERARGGDFREAAECFVDAFFVDGKSNPDDREIGSLERAQASDLSKRYSKRRKGICSSCAYHETCDLMACAGVEYRRYLGDYDYENIPEDVDIRARVFDNGTDYCKPGHLSEG